MIYHEEEEEELIAGEFQILDKISKGGFGDVRSCQSIKTQKKYAIKIEPCEIKNSNLCSHLKREYHMYKVLHGAIGFPNIYCFMTKLPSKKPNHYYAFPKRSYSYLVHELLGPSLESLFAFCHHRFSLKTVLMIADQVLCRLEYIHNKGFVHRDIKPDNFLIGTENNSNVIYMIDLGLSSDIPVQKELIRDPMKLDQEFVGTSRFATISAHLGYEQSQKDDLESLSYSFVYFLKGKLPWQGINISDKNLKCHLISQKKQSIPHNAVFEGLPSEFYIFFQLVHNLGFKEKPKYSQYREMFRKLMIKKGYIYDYQYDWVMLQNKNTEVQQRMAENDNTEIIKIHSETDFNRNLRNSSRRICYEKVRTIEINDLNTNNNAHNVNVQVDNRLTKNPKFPSWMLNFNQNISNSKHKTVSLF